jgi:hypothetical protein
MIRKWMEEEDDDNDDGDVSRLIAINICIYIYVCVCTRHAKEKKMNICIITKRRGKERVGALNFFFFLY